MKNIFVLIFLLSGGITYSQTCNTQLSGEVKDIHDGSLLPNAIVQIKSLGIWAETDSEGRYEFDDLCEGTYTLEINHPECKPITRKVVVENNTIRNFRLEHHIEELNQILLKTNRNNENTLPEATLNKEIIEQYSGATLGDALKEISGVSSLNTGSAIVKPVIHGLHSSRILILNNNVRMQDQQWGVEHAPNIDINSATGLKVIKGAAALQYGGDAIGGVIRVEPLKAPVKDTIIGSAILSAASNGRGGSVTSSILNARESGFYWKAQGTYKYFGDKEAPNYMLSNTGQRERDFSLAMGLNKFQYRLDVYYSYFNTNIGILRASHLGSISDLARAINNGEPLVVRPFTYNIGAPRQDVSHHLLKTSFEKNFYNAGELEIQYSFQFNDRKEFDIRRGEQANRASLDLELMTHNLQSNFTYDHLENFEAKVGIDLTLQNNFANPDTGVRRLIPDYKMFTSGIFMLGNYSPGDKVTLDAGVRYDYSNIDAKKFYLKSRWDERGYDLEFSDLIIGDSGSQWLTNPVFDYHNFSATSGINYRWNNALEANFNLSMASRNPNPSELFSDGLHHSAAIIELGDLNLEQEQAFKVSGSMEGEFAGFTFLINPYLNYINNFILLEPSGIEQTIRGAFPVHEYRQANAQLLGVDVNAGYQFSEKFSYAGNFAYIRGTDLENNRPLVDMPAPQLSNKISYYNNNWQDLRISLSNDIVLEQTRFPNNDFTANVPVDGELVPTDIQISQPPPAYQLFHFNAQTRFTLNTKNDLGIGLSVQNILDTPYRDYLNRQRYYADDLGRNFIVQIKFNY